jgi:hypothetical protein
MKRFTVRVRPFEKGADFKKLGDFVSSSYPSGDCIPQGTYDKWTFLFYAQREKQVLPWLETAVLDFGFEVTEKKVEALTPAQWKKIRKDF